MNARVYTHGKRLALGASATAAFWLGDSCLFALGDGQVLIASGETVSRVTAHEGAALCATLHPDGKSLLTGGDDGRLARTTPAGETEVFAQLGRKWIDHVTASAASGVIVAAQGKDAVVFRANTRTPSHRYAHPSALGGLTLDAKGKRLAASHYGGATLHYALVTEDPGTTLKWAGSHLAITMSPDAEFVITSMQEFGLHGWRMPDKLDLRMSGYPAKTRALSWDKRGRWLASSGAPCAVVWPFAGKMGPQGKQPVMKGERPAFVTCVAFHPREEVLAIGYADGAARVERMDGETFMLDIDEPGEGAVTTLAWSADGTKLALGDEAGRGAVVSIA